MRIFPSRRCLRTGALLLLVTGCSSNLGAPDPATEQGESVLHQWWVLFGLSAVIGGVVLGSIAWCLLRYRRRPGDGLPRQDEGNVPIEVVGVLVPLAIVGGLFVSILVVQDRVDTTYADPDVVVDVTGYRWGWRFEYPDEDVSVVAPPGEEPEIVLPVDQTVRFRLETADVIHSFFVPAFLNKRDLLPGETADVDVRTTRTGVLDGHCAEFCGLNHARMDFVVRIAGDDEYQQWLADQREAAS